jgi:hypothetical protein
VPEPFFRTDPPASNNVGLLSYKGDYLLWRNAWHPNHNPTGGPEVTGHYRSMEGYRLPPDAVAKYEAKKNKPPASK